MKNGKKLCLFLLCTLLAALLIPGLAGAADSDFEITDGVLTRYTGSGGDVTIPEGVTSIGDRAFYSCSGLTSVVIPEGVTSIGNDVFMSCRNLASVTLPSTLESLGDDVFLACTSLTGMEDKSGKFLKIVDGIVYSADGTKILAALVSVSGEVHIPQGVTEIPHHLFSYKNLITSVEIPEGVTFIGNYVFSQCTSLTSVTLPSTLEYLGVNVFESCSSLISIEDKSGKFLKTVDGLVYSADGLRLIAALASVSGEVRIAEGVKEIPYGPFGNNSRITGIVVPEGVIKIGDHAFVCCENLTSVILPSTLESLGESVFDGCHKLTSIEDKSGKFLKTVDGIVYSADGTKIVAVLTTASGELHIAEGVTEIPAWLFNSKSQITSIVIPEGVTSIGDYAFSYCENLISVTLPSTLESLGESVFDGCSSLTSVEDKSGKFLKVVDGIVYSTDGTKITAVLESASGELHIAEGVTEIPAWLFSSKSRITSIVVPEGVTAIGDYAFSYCENLISVTLPSTLESLGESVFDGCSSLTSVEDKSGKFLKVVDGIVYSTDGTKITAVLESASGELHIAEGVTEIPAWLFSNKSRITSIVVPEGVTAIGEYAFSYCENLISITLPSTLESLGEGVFDGCSKLTSIEDQSGKFLKTVDGIVYSADGTKIIAILASASGEIHIAEGVTEIPASLFSGNSRVTSIVVPEGVTRIGDYAFSWCANLTSITLPSTLESLGESIFNGCDNLTSIEDKSGKILKTVDGIVYSADGTKIIAVLTSAVGEVRIAEGVTKIPGWMFDGNSRVTSVIVPEGVTEIGDYAFRGCTNLTSVTLPSTLKTLRDCVFQECPNLASIEDKSGKILKIADGIVYSADGTKLIAVLTSAVGEVRIAEGVTQIPGWLFDSNSRVTSIVVPEGVTEIGYYAFRGCTGLTSVTLPSTLETLRDGVFIECTNLASIEDRSGKFLKVVDGLVYSMDGTQLIAVLASVSGEVRIAEGVTEIPDRLFSKNLRVTSVVVPEGVTSIWFEAFYECTNLTSITLPSTLETIEEGAIPLSTVIRSEPGVYAHTWALENGYTWQSTQQTADPDFEITDGVLTKYTGAGGDVVIPEGVTSIGDQAFYSCAGLTSVVIPEGVASIGSSAFRFCSNLTSVTLPSTVKTFGQFVFSGCEKLSSIEDQSGKCVKILDGVVYNADGTELVAVLTSAAGELRIAEGVTEIPANLFQGNRLITSVIFPEGLTTIGDYAFNYCTNLQTVQLPESLTTIGQFAFANCDHLSQLTLPGGLQVLGSYAFSSTGLRSVTISEGITEIGECAFSYCSKLQTVQLPESLTVIGSSAFSSCTSLSQLTLPEGLTKIGSSAFQSCTNLSQITLPEGLQVLDSYAFAYSGLRSVTLPGGLTSVGERVFASCQQLTSVTLKGMSAILPGGMFGGCTKLQEVNGEDVKTIDGVVYTADGFGLVAALCTASGSIRLEEGIALIPYGFFQGNEQITEVVIPAGVSHIEMSAFMSCSNLTSVTLPESVTHIGVDAFSYCEKLTSINLPEGLVSVGEMAFTGCTSLRSITLPSTLTYLGAGAFDGCTGLEEIQDLSGTLCKTENGIVYSADGTRIITILSTCTGDVQVADGVKVIEAAAFAGHNGITSIVLPESVEQVLGEAFARCSALQSVVLPENLDFVGERLFTNCSSLTSVRLPSNLERLPESTFEGCRELTDISLPASLKTIGMYAFRDCESLREITLPEGLQTIEIGTFLDCTGLTSATLPASLESLQTGVFGGCTGLQELQDLSGKFLKTIDGIVYSADQTKIVAVLASISGNVEFAEGITEIPMGLFDGNTRITGIVIPEGVTRLDWLSFRNCVNLETVQLPESLTLIEDSAFEGCQSLTGITLPANLESIGMEAFAECGRLSSITLPAGLSSIMPLAFRNCTSLTELQDLSGRFYQTVDGIVYSVDGTEAVLALATVSGDVSIMEGVMNIAPYALAGRENITSVILPNSVTGIGLAAIPNSIVIRSDPDAYARTWAQENGYTWQCAQHTEVVLEPAVPATRKHTGLTARIQCSVCGAMLSEPEEVPVFDGKVMKLPTALTSVRRETFLNLPAECFVLPDGCVEIGERAFADCKELTRVEIPSSVTAIAENAFEGCGEGLVVVTPKGSAAERFAQTHGITVTSDEP